MLWPGAFLFGSCLIIRRMWGYVLGAFNLLVAAADKQLPLVLTIDRNWCGVLLGSIFRQNCLIERQIRRARNSLPQVCSAREKPDLVAFLLISGLFSTTSVRCYLGTISSLWASLLGKYQNFFCQLRAILNWRSWEYKPSFVSTVTSTWDRRAVWVTPVWRITTDISV
jgi:hypothetical protein